jgi:uncharacterized protein YbjT (DUF2867 family)
MGENNHTNTMKTALLAGGTGLIGKQVLQLLLEDSHYTKVKVITRKPLEVHHAKLENIVLNFDELAAHAGSLKADDVFCCLGTTIRIAKTKEAFRRVDFEYPVELAKITRSEGAAQFLIITALGSDKGSSVFYNRVKGEVEEAIRGIGFKTHHIFRPSLLLGARTEERVGEGTATAFFKMFGFLIPLKYKAIDSVKVARAMVHFAKSNNSGVHILESSVLQKF